MNRRWTRTVTVTAIVIPGPARTLRPLRGRDRRRILLLIRTLPDFAVFENVKVNDAL